MKPLPGHFEATVLPHLDAAYSLARWLVKDEHNAQDLVHEAFLRAMKYFGGFNGGDARPWLLRIVRNTCYTWLGEQRRVLQQFEFSDADDDQTERDWVCPRPGPEHLLSDKHVRERLNLALEALPLGFREVLVLRELEEMPYDDIAQVLQIPLGTVMSRLSRARRLLRLSLADLMEGEAHGA